ncbi:MAG: dynamin family protein [Actinomycetota bacterium]
MAAQPSGAGRQRPDGASPARAPDDLAHALTALAFDLSPDEGPTLRAERDRLARLWRGVHHRAAEPRAPLLVVVAGGSGAGKSTTVNTLAGTRATETGVVRPTTRAPTLVCHPDDRAWFTDDRVLPDLARVDDQTRLAASARALRIVVSDALAPGAALLDTPDVDSVEVANHALAEEALDAADAWLWLVTARSYADEVGMGYLRRARQRQALLAVALTQVREDERAAVTDDLDRRLADEGLDPALRTVVPHATVVDGALPATAVADLSSWLASLCPTDRRVATRQAALAGLRAALPRELGGLLAAVEREDRRAERLAREAAAPFDAVVTRLAAELEEGLPLRAEVLERWRRLVGGSEALLKVQTAAGRLGEAVRSRLGQPAADSEHVQAEVGGEVARLLRELLADAGRSARAALEAEPAGQAVLEATPALRQAPEGRETAIERLVDGWQARIAALVEEVGGPRKTRARRLSTALNAVATSAILVLFGVSGGLTGGEVGIAAGAAAGSQWLLVKLFGEQEVRRLLTETREDLLARVEELAADERARVTGAVTALSPPAEAVAVLRAHAEGS